MHGMQQEQPNCRKQLNALMDMHQQCHIQVTRLETGIQNIKP